jgi:hypothetical protein
MSARILVLTTLLILSAAVSAKWVRSAEINLPDRAGDYDRNEAPIKGSIRPPLMAGSLWRVVAAELHCRRTPDVKAAIVRQFQRNDILQAEVYRGGSDEVLVNARDANGKPWMPVRGQNSSQLCYVRANHRYIQPVTQATAQ